MMFLAIFVTCLALSANAEGEISFRATPRVAVTSLNPEVTLSCRIPGSVTDVDTGLLIMIEKVTSGEEEAPLKVFKTAGQLKVNGDNRTQAEADLHNPNADGGSTFLTVKILDPVESDSGTYNCSLVYLDKDLSVKTPYTLVNVNVTAVPVAVYVPQETPMNCECEDIWAEINSIKASMASGGAVAAPAPAGQCQVSFSARFSTSYPVSDDTTAVFDFATSNKGDAYDVTTGEFTAPCNGQYYFSVVLRSEQDLDAGYVDGVLMVDDVAAARTSVFVDSAIYNMQQAATGSVVTLTQGQKVKVVVQTTSTGEFIGEEYSVFSGFFLSA